MLEHYCIAVSVAGTTAHVLFPCQVCRAHWSLWCFFQIVGKGMNVSFMWQLDVGNIEDTCPIKTEFTVHYSPVIDLTKLVSDDQIQLYRYNFDIIDYKVHVCC